MYFSNDQNTQTYHNIVQFQSSYSIEPENPKKILKQVIDDELSNQMTPASLITCRDLNRKRNLLLTIMGILIIVCLLPYSSFFTQLTCWFIDFIGLIVCFILYCRLNVKLIIFKTAIKNPDTSIHSIVNDIIDQNMTTTIPPVLKFLLVGVIAHIIPITIFMNPHVIYTRYQDGYAVAKYLEGYNFAEELTIPETYRNKPVLSINSGAFEESWLKRIYLPETIENIESKAFYHAYSLEEITIPSKVTEIKDQTFYGCYELTSVTLPEHITRIGDDAFFFCSSLSNITLPDSLEYLGNCAFDSCSALEFIEIPPKVTAINEGTFSYCESLKQIILHDGITVIDNWALQGCSSLEQITLPLQLTEINYATFSDCSSLSSITIPNGVTIINYCAFEHCSSLKEILIPTSVQEIHDRAFAGCQSLEAIHIPSTTRIVNENAFYDSPAIITRY